MYLPDKTLLHGGTYTIIRFINSGGFGCTYEAEHILLKKRVAIKELFLKDFCNRDENTAHVSVATQSKRELVEKVRRKFIEEARSLSRLQHPGIVKVSDVFEENGTAYYVMDYIDGKSLSQLLHEQGAMPEEQALGYIREISEALEYVHENNRLHLDIKPSNIMVNSDGHAILIDFGASKQYDEENGENTSTLMGKTLGYAPPEQICNDVVRFMPATDIYALGATLYKLLTGITPPSASLLISGEELKPLPSSVSSSTKEAITAAMLLNKKLRPQHVKEFLSLLDKKVEVPIAEIEDETTDLDIKPQVKVPQNVNSEEVSNIIEPVTPPPSNKRNLILGSIGAIASIGILCLFLFGGGQEPGDEKNSGLLSDTINHSAVNDSIVASSSMSDSVNHANKRLEQSSEPTDSTTLKKDQVYSVSGTINGHDFVDLGLSVKWATCNVGANSPEEFGDYFAWGEISPSTNYLKKYCRTWGLDIGDITGNPKYDAATANWGSGTRMPTQTECEELLEHCSIVSTTRNNVKGYLVNGPNGNNIFLPSSGYRYATWLNNTGKFDGYWSSTPVKGDYYASYLLHNESMDFDRQWDFRYWGHTIRPVRD